MKNSQTTIILSFLVLSVISCFLPKQTTQENQLIIGTWTYKNESGSKWTFTSTDCIWEFKGRVIESFNYEIKEEKSVNGKFTLSFLKLVNVNDPDDIYEYEINTLSNDTMVLDYLGDMGTKLTYFTKKLE